MPPTNKNKTRTQIRETKNSEAHINRSSINVKREMKMSAIIVRIREICEKKRGTCRSVVDHMICRNDFNDDDDNDDDDVADNCFAICTQKHRIKLHTEKEQRANKQAKRECSLLRSMRKNLIKI